MTDATKYQFTTPSVPKAYEEFLVPRLFEPWARLLLDEVNLQPGAAVLDVAAGLERLRALLRQDSVLRAASLQPISRCRCWILPEPNRSPQALPKSNMWNRQPHHWQPRMAHSTPCYVSRGYSFSPTGKVRCERCIAS